MQRRTKRLLATAAVLVAVYVASYLWLSRRAYAEADEYGMKGFYYFFPENSASWRFRNYGCVALFWPLNAADRALGWGRHPGSEPLWGLKK